MVEKPVPAVGDDRSFTISWQTDGVVLAAASAVALLGRPVRERLVEPRCFPCDEEAVNPLDREVVRWRSRSLDALSYVLEIAALITPVVSSLRRHGPSRNLFGDLLVYAEIIAINSAANIVVKTVVARPVPRVYTPLFPELEREARGYGSFYSGHCAHTTGALMANAVIGDLQGRRALWPWMLVAGGTVFMSAARVRAGRHFYTDVLAGSAAGAIVGALVPCLHKRVRSDGKGPMDGDAGRAADTRGGSAIVPSGPV
jgi:membrane-associated phospholipid phosphatase